MSIRVWLIYNNTVHLIESQIIKKEISKQKMKEQTIEMDDAKVIFNTGKSKTLKALVYAQKRQSCDKYKYSKKIPT